MSYQAVLSSFKAAARFNFKRAALGICAGLAFSLPAAAELQFGANGHFGEYPLATLEQQFDMLQDLGAKSYRLDVYGYDAGAMNALRTAIDLGKARGIDVLPVLVVKPRSTETDQQHYARAYDMAYGVASRLKSYEIKIYELGNELDIHALVKACETRDNGAVWPCEYGAPSGADVLDYNAERFNQVKALIRGMSDGVRAAIPDAQRIVDTAGWLHYGFLHRLQNEEVDYDITGYHWYSDHGDMENVEGKNVLQILANMGKPIWITEYNRRHGSYDNKDTEQSAYVEQTMARFKEVATLYNLQMAHVYVIFDRPWMTGSIAHYGMVEMDKNSSNAWAPTTKKPVYYAFRRQATNSTTPTPDLVATSFSVPSTVAAGTPLIFKVTVKNQGTKTVAAGAYPIAFWVDNKCVNWVGGTPMLKPGESQTISATYGPNKTNYWSATAGSHTYRVFVDDRNLVKEASETNNTLTVKGTVTAPDPTALPDLVVTSVNVPPAKVGEQVRLSATVQNIGAGTLSRSLPVTFLVNGTPTNWGSPGVTLAPGQSVTVVASSGPKSVNYWIPSRIGTAKVTAWIDDMKKIPEVSDTNNNKTVSITVN